MSGIANEYLKLFPETEFLDKLAVDLQIVFAEVSKQAFTLAYHRH